MQKIIFSILLLFVACSAKKEENTNQEIIVDTVQNTVNQDTTKQINETTPPVNTAENVALVPETDTKLSPNNTKTTSQKAISLTPSTKTNALVQTAPTINNTQTTSVSNTTPSKTPTTPTAAPIKNEIPKTEVPKNQPVVVKQESPKKEDAPQKVTLSHAIFDALLKKYVSSTGKVNYNGLKGEKAKLEEYLVILGQNPPQNSWDRNKKLAFWINAYNANTLKLIIDHYPVASIQKITAKPWDKAFINIGDKTYTLNNIENDIIRPQFSEPRIHFALNCAAKSCPKLLNEAFLPEKLENQLAKQAKEYVNNAAANTISEKKAEVSNIFNWYGKDFDAAGGVIAFLNIYSSIKIKDNAKITFKEYDWSLNE